jgi:DNA replication protein DnaC
MNSQYIFTQCETLKLVGIAQAFERQESSKEYDKFGFNERLSELLDAQINTNQNKRIHTLQRQAKLRYPKVYVSDLDYTLYPKLKPSQMKQLANSDWIHKHHHLLIIGPTGMGKTTLACAIAQEAIHQQISVLFYRLANLLLELLAAKHEKRLNLLFRKLNRASLLVIDDWGNALMGTEERHLFFELIESRDQNASLLITSLYPRVSRAR